MPKKHYENIFDLDEETSKHLFNVVRIISKHYNEIDKNIVGINLLNNNGSAAGQTVMHYHMHILPRYENDDLKNMEFNEHKLNLEEICNELKIK
jgi:histidine triad (HIT) family protein